MSDLDEAALENWLKREVPILGDIRGVEKFPDGQSNPTYRIAGASLEVVLRRKPFGTLLPSAHAVDREYRLMSALHPVGFPVPRPLALCLDPQIIGSIFFVMEMVEGRHYVDGSLPDLPKPDRRAHYEAMIDTLAHLHSLNHEELGLSNFARPGNYFARQVDRWTKQYRASQTDDIEEIEKLIEWLPRTVPEQQSTSIIHGDYRIDNLIFDRQQPKVRAILDWELATIGDPLADFSYFAMNWLLPAEGGAGLGGLELEREGLMTLEEVTERYCRASSRKSMPPLHWYFAFNLFRLAGILQGIKKRIADGNASNAEAVEAVRRIVPLAREAWAQACKAKSAV